MSIADAASEFIVVLIYKYIHESRATDREWAWSRSAGVASGQMWACSETAVDN